MEDIEDVDFVASEHDRLVSSITKLDKTQHITAPTRNEPTSLNSEFNLIKRSNKLQLDKIVKVLEDTAHNVEVSKKLKSSQDTSKVLSKPLEKPQAERLKRATGYEQTKKKVGRWDPVVARNRTVDFVTFPLKTFPSKLQPTKDFLSKLKLKSPLEKELEEIDPPPEPAKDEEDQAYPMTYQEMLEQRQHLAKMRAQQSYKAAKAKRQSKIKSKKYHRVLKKEKLKQQLKEFEELQNTNPEEALKKLEELEKARALERHTLRHKSTGKWAKNKLVRAKYDKEVRQQLAEQLSVGRSLTQKTQDTHSTDDDEDKEENIPDITLAQDPSNPWMLKRSDKTNIDAEFNFGYKKYLKDKMFKRKEESDSESDDETANDNELNMSLQTLKESVKKLSRGDIILDDTKSKGDESVDVTKVKVNKEKSTDKTKRKNTPKKVIKTTATSNWVVDDIVNTKATQKEPVDVTSVFESLDNKVANKVQKKLKKLKKEINKLEKGTKHKQQQKEMNEEVDSLEYFKMKNQKIRPIIDEELIETHKGSEPIHKESCLPNVLPITEKPVHENGNVDIDPSRFFEVKPKYLSTALPKGDHEFDDLDDEQVVPKVDIEEVFEEDDVVASFRQEKEDEINKDTPQDIDLSLPGWGNWGGKGVKAPKRKRNRFILKAPPKMPRRDENKGDVIINEIKNPKLVSHKVTDLPFPFASIKDYEASIRAPLGNTFIPETAHKKLIRPNVITKAGTVIEPMDEEELLVQRNRTFKNESVIKLLAKQ